MSEQLYGPLDPKVIRNFNVNRILNFKAALAFAGLVLVLTLGGQIFVHKDADEILVVQSPIQGTLTWHNDTNGGIRWRGFGKITRYRRRSQFWFSNKASQGQPVDESITIRFNDGGHASISGSISWAMSTDEKNATLLHTQYGSQEAVEQQLVRTTIEKSVYMTGPLMSSKESYADRRNELLLFIEDQTQHGVYRTETRQVKQPDPMTGVEKTVNVVNLVRDANGQIARVDESPLTRFGITTFNPSINNIVYDKDVEAQIQQQQRMTMQVQTAVAEAKQAEQRAITAEKNGQADAAKAKWAQEVLKATAVTEAEQKLRVAELAAKAAEQTRREQILLGQGEAERRKLVMNADGALDNKLQAYVEVNKLYADAIKGYAGNWVPLVVTGGSGSQAAAGSGAISMMEILGIKAARDLAIDMGLSGGGKTKPKP